MGIMEKVSLEKLCTFEKGQTGLASATAGDYPLVTTAKERKSCSTYQFDTKAVCIPLVSSTGHGHASLNNVHYQEGKFALGSILVAVIPKDEKILNAQFLHLYLSSFKDTVLVPLMSGAANVSLSISKIKTVEIPLPSIGKQLEIVTRFNNTETELAELLDEISTQEDFVKKLRQSILQEAIEGKLTAKWRAENPAVESASVLLEKIKAEKEKLIKDGKIKKEKPLPEIKVDEIPFDIPESWSWCSIEQIIANKKYSLKAGPFGSSLTKSMYSESGYKIYGQEQVIKQDPYYGEYYINEDKYKELISCSVESGDILLSLVGTIGKLLILPDDIQAGIINPRLIKISLHNVINKNYFSFLYATSFIQQQLKSNASGQTMDVVTVKSLKGLCLPLPSQEEQKAIVEKIENLFAMCDELEEQIKASKSNTAALTGAILKEAFERY